MQGVEATGGIVHHPNEALGPAYLEPGGVGLDYARTSIEVEQVPEGFEMASTLPTCHGFELLAVLIPRALRSSQHLRFPHRDDAGPRLTRAGLHSCELFGCALLTGQGIARTQPSQHARNLSRLRHRLSTVNDRPLLGFDRVAEC